MRPLILLILLLTSACAHISPIPCEDLPIATANGDRTYARLCPR